MCKKLYVSTIYNLLRLEETNIYRLWHYAFLQDNPVTASTRKVNGLRSFLELLKVLDMAHALKKENSVLPRHHLQPQIMVPTASSTQQNLLPTVGSVASTTRALKESQHIDIENNDFGNIKFLN